ncbi:MAG: hypothetical protein VCC99_07185 [Alphaproteobacteria bacterium]
MIAWARKMLVTAVIVVIGFAIYWYVAHNPEGAKMLVGELLDTEVSDFDEDDDDAEPGSRVEIVDGVPVVALDEEDRVRAGIETAVLQPVTFRPHLTATGAVVDILPLLVHRGTCLAAIHEVERARTHLTIARREFQRLSALNADGGSIAAKRVQEAEAQVRLDRVAVTSAESRRDVLIGEARQGWGPVVAGWLLDAEASDIQALIDGESVLVHAVMPVGEALPVDLADVRLTTARGDTGERPASYVSAAPYTDPLIQGESHFFRADAFGLRAGMHTILHIPLGIAPRDGVIVPDSAVVWALGQSWAYLALDNEHFARIAVDTAIERPGGWFVADGIAPGERIVVTGAQTLYAEEFRWQVFEEDDD